MLKLKVLDPVDVEILEGEELILPCLSYQTETYRQVQWGRKRVPKRKSLIRRQNHRAYFLAGFLHRVRDYCFSNKIDLEIDDPNMIMEPFFAQKEPSVEGRDILDDKWSFQYDLIKQATIYQRGIVKSATGSGKTIMMLGFISCYPNARVLFLCNTHTPISQFKEKLAESGLPNQIDISTVQSFYRKKPKEYGSKYDIIIIDECHEGLRSSKGMYAKVLRNSLAPIRLGFTATLPDKEEDRLNMEGLLGPVIGELTMQEGIEREVLAKPRVVIKKLPENRQLGEYRKYQDAYYHCVVANRALNRQIVNDALDDCEDGPVLILVTELEHGRNVLEMARGLYGEEFVFVHGETGNEDREAIRKGMIDGTVDIVVATAVFKKGLDVPNLASVVLGFGGKSDAATMQAIGRVTRNVDGKKGRATVRDYFCADNLHMIKHFGHRLCLYIEEDWL